MIPMIFMCLIGICKKKKKVRLTKEQQHALDDATTDWTIDQQRGII